MSTLLKELDEGMQGTKRSNNDREEERVAPAGASGEGAMGVENGEDNDDDSDLSSYSSVTDNEGDGGGENPVEEDITLRHRVPFVTGSSDLGPFEAWPLNEAFFESLKDVERYQVHAILDKPVYKPGEVIRASCFVLDAFDQTPLQKKTQEKSWVKTKIKDPKGTCIAEVRVVEIEEGVVVVQWTIPQSVVGGEYQMMLEVFVGEELLTAANRRFEIRATRASNAKLNKKLEFARDGYCPGDTVLVTLTSLGGDGVTNAMFTAVVDGDEIAVSDYALAQNGVTTFSFQLPADIEQGEGIVTAKVSCGASLESVSKTIPIILKKLDIGVFPEGGVLVAGHQQRIYVEALDSQSGKPVDFKADILSGRRRLLGEVESLHEGRGVSAFFLVPGDATKVLLRVTSPATMAGQTVKLPIRHNDATDRSFMVSLSIQQDVFKHEFLARVCCDPSVFRLRTGTAPRPLTVVVSKLEKVLCERTVQPEVDENGISLGFVQISLEDDIKHFGVLRVTVQDSNTSMPLAERLIFRLPVHVLEIELSAAIVDDIADFKPDLDYQTTIKASPADGVAVQVKTYRREVDEKTGEPSGARVPVAAVLAMRVTNSALAATVEERLLPPRLQDAVWLETEVDRLHDAGQYLPGSAWAWHTARKDGPVNRGTPRQRLGLLLGTQGWRMFAYFHAEGFSFTGRTPLERGELVPTRLSGEREGRKAWRTSPVSKSALDRLLCLYGLTPPRPPPGPSRRGRNGADFATKRFRKAAPPPPKKRIIKNRWRDDDAEVLELIVADPQEAFIADGLRFVENNDEDVEECEEDEALDDAFDESSSDESDAGPISDEKFLRVYTHPRRKHKDDESESDINRTDFTETVYHNPSVVTALDNTNAFTARFAFGLSEASGARFMLHADGFAKEGWGVIGGGALVITTTSPLEIDFSLPTSLVSGDRAFIPVSLQNRTGEDVTISSSVRPESAGLGTKTPAHDVGAVHNARIYTELITRGPIRGDGRDFSLTISAKGSKGAHDGVTRGGVLSARGFPVAQYWSGTLKTQGDVAFTLTVPEDYVEGTLQPIIRVYTSPVGTLTKALEELIREPCGCFEQTSSTTYPLVFVLQYLNTHAGASTAALAEKAKNMLTFGYSKLASYECPGGGFEWFGYEPGHEALTAYGLLQFAAMVDPAVGIQVDSNMVERTKKWMDSRRDGKGGFLRNSKSLDCFGGAPELTTNAYITWALVRAGLLRSTNPDPEVQALIARATNEAEVDPYVIALAALSLYDATSPSTADLALARTLAKRLSLMQDLADGCLRRGAQATITRSRGDALEIEATALGALVWLHDVSLFALNAYQAVQFISSKCKNGRFASTQATALSLMAIVEFDRIMATPLPPGRVELLVDGKLVDSLQVAQANSKELDKEAIDGSQEAGVLEFSSERLLEALGDGPRNRKMDLRLNVEESGTNLFLPFSMAFKYSVVQPKVKANSEAKLELVVRLEESSDTVREGDVVTMRATLKNVAMDDKTGVPEALPMVVAVLGLPGGFEPRTEQLRELKDSQIVDFVETKPGQVILYWRALKPEAVIQVPVQCVAAIPGTFEGLASRAYMYYADEDKVWAAGIRVTIKPQPTANSEMLFW